MVVVQNEDPRDEAAINRLFAALSDPTRRDIFRRSIDGRLSVSALAREYPISLPAVQKHVTVLEEAGLVSKHPQGRESIVRGEIEALERARAALDQLETLWRGRVARMDRALDL